MDPLNDRIAGRLGILFDRPDGSIRIVDYFAMIHFPVVLLSPKAPIRRDPTNPQPMNNRHFPAILKAGLISLSLACLTACGGGTHEQGNGKEHTHTDSAGSAHHEHAAVYQCPMKCEGDKTYAEAGKCPVCNMDLALVE